MLPNAFGRPPVNLLQFKEIKALIMANALCMAEDMPQSLKNTLKHLIHQGLLMPAKDNNNRLLLTNQGSWFINACLQAIRNSSGNTVKKYRGEYAHDSYLNTT